MHIIRESCTFPGSHHNIRFQLKTRPTEGRSIASGSLDTECAYVCSDCGSETPSFLGKPDETAIPEHVLESMSEHRKAHQ